MQHSFLSFTGYQSVPAVVVLVIVFLVSPLAAGESAEMPPGVYSEFTLGVYLMEKGSVLEAVDHLEYAWRASHLEVAVGRRLAEAYYTLKNFTHCEIVADAILAKVADDYEASLLKAKVRYIKRDPSASIALLESIRETHGSNFEVERLIGNISYEVGDLNKALGAYERCIEINPDYPYIYYRYGLLLTQTHRYAEAESSYKKAVALDPEFLEPAIQLADLYAATGRAEEAIPVLEGILAVEPGNASALTNLAEICLETGRLDKGIKLLEDRRSYAPLPRDAEIIRGRIYYEAKAYDEAYAVFFGIFEHEQKSPELARILGEICLKTGDLNKSREYFDKAIEIDPSDYRSYLGLFFAGSAGFSETGSAVLLLTDAERADLLDSAGRLVSAADFEGNYLLGVSYLSIDSLNAAERHLLRAKDISGNDEATLLNLANVYEKTKRFESAEQCLVILHELKPTDPAICNFYGYLLAVMGKDLDKAETLVREALRQDPENGYYLDSLGWVYYQMGDYSRAVLEIEKAAQRVPDDPVILEHLGDAYRALHNFDKARMAYERSSLLQDGNTGILEKIKSTNQKKD